MKRGLKTMLVGELKQLLEDYDYRMPVVFAYDYGDYWHTRVAGEIGNDDTVEGQIVWSEYHKMFKKVENCDEAELEGEERIDALILG